MILAEIEIRHSRDVAPTRRVALGERHLPTEPAPGSGGMLLAGIVGAYAYGFDDELRDGIDRLLWDLEHRQRVAQPRLRHRLQTDVVGLDRSRHRLVGNGEAVHLELDGHGAPLPQVLGAMYAARELAPGARPAVFRLLRRASRWEGGAGAHLMRHLSGEEAAFGRWRAPGDEGWALRVLGFPVESEPLRGEIIRRFRRLVREAHPDHGASVHGAGARIQELAEAKRILLAGA